MANQRLVDLVLASQGNNGGKLGSFKGFLEDFFKGIQLSFNEAPEFVIHPCGFQGSAFLSFWLKQVLIDDGTITSCPFAVALLKRAHIFTMNIKAKQGHKSFV